MLWHRLGCFARQTVTSSHLQHKRSWSVPSSGRPLLASAHRHSIALSNALVGIPPHSANQAAHHQLGPRPWHGPQHDTGDRGNSLTAKAAAAFSSASVPPEPAVPTQKLQKDLENEQMKNEMHSLNVAITANILIFIAKLWVHFVTGSSAMLAEALHSVADVLNQALLRVGVLKARQAPTAQHPYGYFRDRFVWSLISAVGIFFLGAGASFIHGLHTLMAPQFEIEGVAWSYLVLSISLVLEGYSLWVASRSVMTGASKRKLGLLQYVKSGKDPTTVAVMMEDGGAVVGLLIAGGCTALTHYTGNAMWDAVGSMMVGCLLGGIATFLVQKNRQLLIGRSMQTNQVAQVMQLLNKDPVVLYVTETKTEEIGPDVYRFKAEVAWRGDALVDRYLTKCGRRQMVERLRQAAQSSSDAELEAWLRDYGNNIISTVGAEVDRIEADIQKMNPGIKWVDLETDRGRYDLAKYTRKPQNSDGSSNPPQGASTSAPAASSSGCCSGDPNCPGTSSSGSSMLGHADDTLQQPQYTLCPVECSAALFEFGNQGAVGVGSSSSSSNSNHGHGLSGEFTINDVKAGWLQEDGRSSTMMVDDLGSGADIRAGEISGSVVAESSLQRGELPPVAPVQGEVFRVVDLPHQQQPPKGLSPGFGAVVGHGQGALGETGKVHGGPAGIMPGPPIRGPQTGHLRSAAAHAQQ